MHLASSPRVLCGAALALSIALALLGELRGPGVGLYGLLVLTGGLASGRRTARRVAGASLGLHATALVLLYGGALPGEAPALTVLARTLGLTAVVVAVAYAAAVALGEDLRQRARRAEGRYRALFDAVREPIVVWDPASTTILDANPAAVELSGLPREELIGRTGLALLPLEDQPRIEAALRRGPLRPRAGGLLQRYVRPDGDERIVHVEAGRFDHAGSAGIVAVVKDMTDTIRRVEEQQRYAENLEREVEARTADLAQVNRRLRRMQAELVEAQRLAAAEELAGAVAHSINNPLGALLGTVELALEAAPKPDPALERIHRLASRIRSVVDSTLELYRRGAMKRVREDPAELVELVRDEIGARARAAGVQVDTKVEADLPALLADRTLLLAALVSVAENAIAATGRGGQVLIECERVDALHAVRFRIADTGPGVPAALRSKVFDPFFTTKGGGTGLGLSIANGIVQGHQGSIRLEDRPLGGTTVVIELPTERAAVR